MEELIQGCQRYEHKGQYKVVMDVPSTSAMQKTDIEKALAYASWDQDPNELSFEGSRAVLMPGTAHQRSGIEFNAYQISGIGYTPIQVERQVSFASHGSRMMPPNTDNFMDLMSGTLMSTSFYRGKKVNISTPDFRALGSYTLPELQQKVKNTDLVSGMNFKRFAVPFVEAYGFYHDERLQNQDGPFGFFIMSVPDADSQRYFGQASDFFMETVQQTKDIEEHLQLLDAAFLTGSIVLAKALRELHDSGFVHLQPHLSNIYQTDPVYIVDWATLKSLPKAKKSYTNVLNRGVDIQKTVNDYERALRTFADFSTTLGDEKNSLVRGLSIVDAMNIILGTYIFDNPRPEFTIQPWIEASRGRFSDFDVLVNVLKDHGFEGFKKKLY